MAAAGAHGPSSGFDAIVGKVSSGTYAGATRSDVTSAANGGVGTHGVGGPARRSLADLFKPTATRARVDQALCRSRWPWSLAARPP